MYKNNAFYIRFVIIYFLNSFLPYHFSLQYIAKVPLCPIIQNTQAIKRWV